MKRILFLFFLLPYLASAQVAKDTVTVLTIADIPADAIRDTTNFTFVQDNAFKKATFDSLAKYTRVKLQTYTLDSTHIAASGLNLQGTRFTGVLPVARGGTGQSTLTLNKVLVGNGTSGVLQPTNLHWDNSSSRLGIGTSSPLATLYVKSPAANNGFISFEGSRGTALGTIFEQSDKSAAIILRDSSANAKIALNTNSDSYILNRLALNTTTATSPLTIKSSGLDNGLIDFVASDGSPLGVLYEDGSGSAILLLRDEAGNADAKIVANGDSYLFQGNFGLGNNSPTERLHVTGNARITDMNGVNDIGASATGVLQAATSDYNLKNSIQDSDFGLNHILRLKPVTFLYNNQDRKIHSEIPEIGFIAQDVNDVIPNAVSPTGEGALQLDYRAITATLTKAIQEQQAQIEQLKQRITQLENK